MRPEQDGAVPTAAEFALAKVGEVRDDPDARLALLRSLYAGPSGDGTTHLPYRRAAIAFVRWQLRRGLLGPPDGPRPGSPWWRAVNERLLRDGWEALALWDGYDPAGATASAFPSVEFISPGDRAAARPRSARADRSCAR